MLKKLFVLCLCLGMVTAAFAKGKESKPFAPSPDAPGYQLASDIMAFTVSMDLASSCVSNAKSALAGMSDNKSRIDSLDAQIEAASTIEDPKEKEKTVKSLEAEKSTVYEASKSQLETKTDLSAEQKDLLGKVFINLAWAAAWDVTAVASANEMIKQSTALQSEVTTQASKNPLKAGKLKANLGYVTAASAGALPSAVAQVPSQAVDISGMLVTVTKMATANGVTLPEANSVKATDSKQVSF